jgi:hypothetical protein
MIKTKPIFYPENHTYVNKMGVNYKPVTSFIHSFCEEEDWDKIAQKFIDKRSPQQIVDEISSKYNLNVSVVYDKFKRDGINPTTVRYFWELEKNRACNDGSNFHLEQEEKDIKHNGAIDNTVSDSIYDLYNLADGIYTELMIWDDDYLICGKSDKVIIRTDPVTKDRYIKIEDYKTNKELKVNYNFINKKTGEPVVNKYMKKPISNFVDCNYIHYCLQLSMYGFLLERKGFIVEGLTLLHTVNYSKDDLKVYELPYLKRAIIDMLNYDERY